MRLEFELSQRNSSNDPQSRGCTDPSPRKAVTEISLYSPTCVRFTRARPAIRESLALSLTAGDIKTSPWSGYWTS
ncbi:hypothetical protein [Apis mellifera associated microvirus 16]|nr:hypothetical protein [Apis mellifera associated microvirus 16]